jgi:hypothetical protein
MLYWLKKLIAEFKPKRTGYQIYFNAKGISVERIK